MVNDLSRNWSCGTAPWIICVSACGGDLTLTIVGTWDRHSRGYFRELAGLAASLGPWIELRQDGRVVGEHRRVFGRGGCGTRRRPTAPDMTASGGRVMELRRSWRP